MEYKSKFTKSKHVVEISLHVENDVTEDIMTTYFYSKKVARGFDLWIRSSNLITVRDRLIKLIEKGIVHC